MTSVTQYDLAAWATNQSTKSKATAVAKNIRGEAVTPIISMRQQWVVFRELQKTFAATRIGYIRGLHPAIEALLRPIVDESSGKQKIVVNEWQAKCIITLALEQPSVPQDGNKQRVSYWRTDDHVKQGKRTTVSLGRYVKRHFPQIPDHMIRNFVGLYAEVRYEFWKTTELIVKACNEGPYSCMQWSTNNRGPLVDHPYQVYTPELGWKICVGLKDGKIISRALIYRDMFVKAYQLDDSYPSKIAISHDMTAWLESKGYNKVDGWPDGTCFAAIKPKEINSPYIFPYLDGDNVRVSMHAGRFEVDWTGEYDCTSDDGTASAGEKCHECDNYEDEDHVTEIGHDSGHYVCRSCLREMYTYAIGRNGQKAYFRDDKVTEIDGKYYADEFIHENGYVYLETGEYVHEDFVVYVEDQGYYHVDCVGDNPKNDTWTVCQVDCDYYLREDCDYCYYSKEWKLKENITEVEFDDEIYTVEEGYEEALLDKLFHEQARKAGQVEMEFA